MAATQAGAILRHLHRLAETQVGQGLTDGQLLQRFLAQREEAAFAALMRRHGRLVWSVCRHVLRSEHDAEDAFQAVFLVLVRKAAVIRSSESVGGWLHGVAYRIAARARYLAAKRQQRERRVALSETASAPSEEAVRDLQALLDAEVAHLPEKLRAPFILCCLEGRSRAEAATELAWKEGTVSSRIAQARRLLHERLARHGVTLSAALTASVLWDQSASAALVQTTQKVASLFVARRTVGPYLSPAVAALVQKGMRTMVNGKWSVVFALVLAASLAGGFGLLVGSRFVQQTKPPASGLKTELPDVKTDQYGDPLPPGAVVRVGTIRFRHAEGVRCSVFSPDGKTLITGGHDGLLRLWDLATGKELRRFVGHRGATGPIALSPNGALLASWGSTGSNGDGVRVWELATAKEVRHLDGPTEGHLVCLAWSPDNKTLAAGGENGVGWLWDAIAGNTLHSGVWHKGPVNSVAFSPDGTKLASTGGYKDGTIHLRSLAGEHEPLVLRAAPGDGREKEIHFVAFSRDGKTLISGGDCYGDNIGPKVRSVNTIAVWDATTGKRLRHFRVGDDQEKPNEGAASVALSADCKTVALGYWDHTIRLWDLESAKPRRTLTGYPDRFYPAYHLAFAPDGKALAACGSHHAVCLLDTATGKPLFDDGSSQKSNIRSVALSPDGKVLATASHDYTVCLWDAVTGKPLHQLRGHTSWVYTVAFAPDGRTLASGSSDSTIRLWDSATGKELRKLTTDKEQGPLGMGRLYISNLAFSPDGKVLAASHDQNFKDRVLKGEDGVHLWDPADGKELRRLANSPVLLHGGAMAFSADGKTLCTLVSSLRRWRVSTGEEIPQPVLQGQPSSDAITLSRDGMLAACSDYNGSVLVWDAATGHLLLTIRTPEGTAHRPAFSPDNRYLALCGASYNLPAKTERLAIELWELASGKKVHKQPLPAYTGVSSVAFSADGRRLATGMADTTALIWDLGPSHTGKERPLVDHWSALAGDDAAQAYQALGAFIDSPGTTAFLKQHVQPAAKIDAKPILHWITDLDSDEFAVREKASRELQKYGDETGPVFRQVLAGDPSPEVRRRLRALLERPPSVAISGERLRQVRAITILDRIGSPEARKLLAALAEGAPEARLTREAKATLERLSRSPTR
jgi:RNA polymerase sigma factor (sigma-70 family)